MLAATLRAPRGNARTLGVLVATIGQWEFTNDRAATERAYSEVLESGAEACGCQPCRNYLAVRDRLLPETFVTFLRSLGIDPRKEAEAYHICGTAPGKHYYGGWYHFVGELQRNGDFPMVEAAPGFRFYLLKAHAPHLKQLDGHSLVQVEFEAEAVPWVTDDPEPGQDT